MSSLVRIVPGSSMGARMLNSVPCCIFWCFCSSGMIALSVMVERDEVIFKVYVSWRGVLGSSLGGKLAMKKGDFLHFLVINTLFFSVFRFPLVASSSPPPFADPLQLQRNGRTKTPHMCYCQLPRPLIASSQTQTNSII